MPVLDKQTVRDHLAEMISSEVLPGKCVQRHTSGTSGMEFMLPELPLESLLTNALWGRIYMRAGFRPWHRQSKITILSRFGERRHFIQRLGLFRRNYIDSTISPAEKVELLKRQKPDALVCWATMLEEITKYLEDTNSHLDIPIVFSTANMLWPEVRRRAEQRLRTRVFDVYGAVETGPVAWECGQHQGFHVQSDQVMVELVDEQGNPGTKGRLVCTVLWRRALPLIRYDVGDAGEWSETPCPCGSPLPLLKCLSGRVTDLIRLPDGTHINSVTLRHAMIGKPGVEQYQLVQESPVSFRLRLVVGPDYSPAVEQSIHDEFNRQFSGSLFLRIVRVGRIRVPNGVKFTPMVTLTRVDELRSRGVDVRAYADDEP